MGQEVVPTQVERHQGSLYSIDADHTVKKHVDKIDISNGLAWSLDNTLLYYVDSLPRKVYAFDFDLSTGSLCEWDLLSCFGCTCIRLVSVLAQVHLTASVELHIILR